MLILSLDTTQSSVQLALVNAQRTLLATEVFLERMESLPAVMASLFQTVEICPEQLNGICFITGPGNYTGIRAGLMVARTLSLRYQLPLQGLTRLEAAVYAFRHYGLPVSPLFSVRQGQFYTALAYWQDAGVNYLLEPRCLELSDWLSEIHGSEHFPLFLTHEVLPGVSRWIDMGNLAVAAAHWMLDFPGQDPLPSVVPFYIRPAVQGVGQN